MDNSDFFPITIPALENENFTYSEYDFRPNFLINKPKDTSWYAYDVIIHSLTDVEYVVYAMVGKETARFKAVVEVSVTGKFISRKIHMMAVERRELELLEAEKKIIDKYANEIYQSLFGIN